MKELPLVLIYLGPKFYLIYELYGLNVWLLKDGVFIKLFLLIFYVLLIVYEFWFKAEIGCAMFHFIGDGPIL